MDVAPKRSVEACMRSEIFEFDGGGRNLTQAAIHSGFKQRLAAFGEQDLRALRCQRTLNLDQPVDDRVFPNRLARAMALPRVHRLLIGARTVRYPSEKFQY